MTDKLDLLKIAQEEQSGDVFKYLDGICKRSKVQPRGISDAVIWEGGNTAGGVKPVAHALTDMFALNGTLMALDVLGLPFLGVPMMAQYRHDTKLKSLEWFGKLDATRDQVVHRRRRAGQRQRQEGRGDGQVRQRAAAHRGRRLLQRPALRHDHQRALHARPALLAGRQEVPGRHATPATSTRR